MDPFNKRILRTFRGREPMDLQQILDEVDFSNNTLSLHLNNMLERGLITKEKTPAEVPG